MDWIVDIGTFFLCYSEEGLLYILPDRRFCNHPDREQWCSYIGGIGDVVIRTSEGSELILREVIHAPYLRLNLISCGKLDEEGYTSQLERGRQKLT